MPLKANRLTLTATLTQKEPLRYSPAGIPILNVRLLHQSEQLEAGKPRTVTCEIPAIAIGEVALKLQSALEGIEQQDKQWQFSGFLATKRRYEIAELHITEFIETPAPDLTGQTGESRNR